MNFKEQLHGLRLAVTARGGHWYPGMFTGPHIRRKHSAHSNTVFDGNKYHLSSVIQTSQRWICLCELMFGGSKALWFECILSLMGQGRGQWSPADQERQHWEYNGYKWKIQSICWSTFHSVLLLIREIYEQG